jgi:mannose-6-phosphate isomerase-like protein (cupin superfamily)
MDTSTTNQATAARVIGPKDGKAGFLGQHRRALHDRRRGRGRALLARRTPDVAARTGGTLHRHTREDEYSYVLEGRMGALLGEEVLVAGPGDLVFKPRNQWHTFWNAGDEPDAHPGDHLPGRL